MSDGTGNTSQASNFITASVNSLSASGLLGTEASATLALNAMPAANDAVTIGGTTYTFVAALTQSTPGQILLGSGGTTAQNLTATLNNLAAAINGSAGSGTVYSNSTTANADATASVVGDSVLLNATAAGNNAIAGGGTIASTVGTGTAETFLNGATFSGGSTSDLLTATDAQTALAAINGAIASVAATRGQIGAVINRLQSASNVISNQVTNLTSAENTITAADVPTAVANLTKYSILEQTGISALAQANQQQQLVLKLLQ